MSQSLILSRRRLLIFLRSPREFQERFLLKRPWPEAPPSPEVAEAAARGRLFHDLLARHFAGLPGTAEIGDEEVRRWWATFQRQGPALPAGLRLPETSLTVPIGRHFLTGRFDLVVAGDGPTLHIYDWKTERRPRPVEELRGDWQTRFYWALAAAGGSALGYPVAADQVFLTYWFAADPTASATFPYSAAAHERNWSEMTRMVDTLDDMLRGASGPWPTSNPLDFSFPTVEAVEDEQDADEIAIEPPWY
jgi:hypothetical protein